MYMAVQRHIPNLLTLMNLSAGVLALVILFDYPSRDIWVVYLLAAAAFFDFIDGLAARLLAAHSLVGKELDSLADLLSFGLLPAAIVYKLLYNSGLSLFAFPDFFLYIPALLLVLFSALRLARFNVLPANPSFFSGLSTTANGFFWGTVWAVYCLGFWPAVFTMPLLWSMLTLCFSLLLIIPLPMFSLKVSSLRVGSALWQYLLVFAALLLVLFFSYRGAVFIVPVYIVLSLLRFLLKPKKPERH